MDVPVLLIPGMASDSAIWRCMHDVFPLNADCILIETLVGQTITSMAQAILEGAPSRFAAVGLSMGGMVALEMARLAPQRVVGLALLGTTAAPDTEEGARKKLVFSEQVRKTDDFPGLVAPFCSALVSPGATDVQRSFLLDMMTRVGSGVFAQQNEALGGRRDLRPFLAELAIPTFVIVGADDSVTPLEKARELVLAIPDASLHIIPLCGHLPPLEQPEQLSSILNTWFRKLPAVEDLSTHYFFPNV